ncbi:MAG: PEP-CTERM sorting domain-containing protein [Armatimonadetes bacterium]|nr:PEP-CTERM sorting domain-containing protein [Armatimonadota bacterium]
MKKARIAMMLFVLTATCSSSLFADFTLTVFEDTISVKGQTITHSGSAQGFFTFQPTDTHGNLGLLAQAAPDRNWGLSNPYPVEKISGGNMFDVVGMYGMANTDRLRFAVVFSMGPEGVFDPYSYHQKLGPGDLRVDIENPDGDYGVGLRTTKITGGYGGESQEAKPAVFGTSNRRDATVHSDGKAAVRFIKNDVDSTSNDDWYRYDGLSNPPYDGCQIDGRSAWVFDPFGADWDQATVSWTPYAGSGSDRKLWVAEGIWNWSFLGLKDGEKVNLYTGTDCNNDRMMVQVTVVPEPSSLVLIGSAMLGMAGLCKRRRLA